MARFDRGMRGQHDERFPWMMPAIVSVAVAIMLAGIIWAALLGHLF